jgi:outer membrane protein OmpA-like peptidoglycan-associated protein
MPDLSWCRAYALAGVLIVACLAPPLPVRAQVEGDVATMAELKAALAELRRRLAEQPKPATDAQLQVARRQIERLTGAMVGLKRERDGLRGEVAALRADGERLRSDAAAQRQRLVARDADIIRLERKLADAAAAQVPAALTTPEPARHSETMSGAAFAQGGTALREEAILQLDAIATWLRTEPGGIVVIEGHTDGVGDPAANQRLSLERAEAVRDQLVARGVSSERMAVLGRGEDLPVASDETAEGRAVNRRVVVTLEP